MSAAAFVLLALVLTSYVLLDGYDLGAGTLHLFLGRTDEERAATFDAIGPFWSGNEVMLVAAGALLFALFPKAYAAAFSGFYLPFIVVLWLLMGRGMAIELRNHFESDLWRGFWDVTFAATSALLSFVLGVALGNVLRGVPVTGGIFFAGSFGFLLNGYAVTVGAFASATLAMHGAAFVAWRSPKLSGRATHAARALSVAVFALDCIVTWATLRVHPFPFGIGSWLDASVGVCALVVCYASNNAAMRFVATSVFVIVAMLSAAGTLFPYLLPALPPGRGGIDIYNASPGHAALETALLVFGVGLTIVAAYATAVARRLLVTLRR